MSCLHPLSHGIHSCQVSSEERQRSHHTVLFQGRCLSSAESKAQTSLAEGFPRGINCPVLPLLRNWACSHGFRERPQAANLRPSRCPADILSVCTQGFPLRLQPKCEVCGFWLVKSRLFIMKQKTTVSSWKSKWQESNVLELI